MADGFFSPPILIEEVKKRPALYRIDTPVDREERLLLWKEIGAAIYSDWETFNKATAYDKVLQLQRKWRSLRDAYNRELRLRKSNDRRHHKKVYRYFKSMTFLGGFTGTISDDEEETSIIPDLTESLSNPEDTTILLEPEETPEPKIVKKTRKRQRRRRSNDSIPAPEELEMPMFPLEMSNDNDDSDRLFMLSFLPEMKQLPVNLKMWVRAQIANAMQEAVSCHYNNTVPSGSTSFEKNGLDIKRPQYDSTEE